MFSNSYVHHGIGDDVDLENFLDLEGAIELVEWINPHVVINLTTEDARGITQKWLIQADTPNSLLRKGINRSSLEHMTNIQIRVYPSLSAPCANECYAYGYEYRAPSGRTYTLHKAMYELVHQLTVQQKLIAAHNKQVNKGHSLLRTVCEWLRHSIANGTPQTAPITKGVMCTIPWQPEAKWVFQ